MTTGTGFGAGAGAALPKNENGSAFLAGGAGFAVTTGLATTIGTGVGTDLGMIAAFGTDAFAAGSGALKNAPRPSFGASV